MAETADNVAQRYAVLEQAYTKEDWATVLRDGEALLGQLRQANNPGLLGLQMRLQLLLGHTQLYGFADKDAAARFYGAVAAQSSEAALTKIAEQGLEQCSGGKAAATEPEPEPEAAAEPRAEPEPQAEAEATPEAVETPATATPPAAQTPVTASTPVTFDAAATAPPGSGTTTPAAPWLTSATPASTTGDTPPAAGPVGSDTAGTPTPASPWVTESLAPSPEPLSPAPQSLSPEPESLIPEVVEEPELIELHQADPRLAEEVELTWKEPAPMPETAQGPLPSEPLPEEDEDLLSGLLLVRLG